MAQAEAGVAHGRAAGLPADAARVLSGAVLRSAGFLGLSRATLSRLLGVSEAGVREMAER